MEIFREFTFDAAHKLHNLPEGHKCANLHGHTYRVVVYVDGPLDPTIGWVIDFAEIKRAAGDVLGQLDHAMLNDVPGLEQPTAERIAIWIWDRLKPQLAGLSRIQVWENPTNGCEYRGE